MIGRLSVDDRVGRLAECSLDPPPHDETTVYPCERGLQLISRGELFSLRPETSMAYTTLDLSTIRPGCTLTTIDTPEAKSLLACFEERNGGLVLTPGRLHLGARRRLDAAIAAFQMMSLEAFAEAVDGRVSDETVIVSILREGPILRVQENLYLATGWEAKGHALISVHHVPDESQGHKGLRAEADYYRCELTGHEAQAITQAIVADSIAGGRNMIETLKIILRDLPRLERVVVLSVHASLRGIERVVKHAPDEIRQLRFFAPNGAMAASATNHYDCYLPRHRPETLPDPRDLALFDIVYGPELAPWIPIGGDWSANFLNPARARDIYSEQLAAVGLTIDEIATKAAGIVVQDLVDIGFEAEDLMPYSTLLDVQGPARHHG